MAEPGWRWRAAKSSLLLPRPLRDWLYNRIAKNRYALFCRKASCEIPSAELKGGWLASRRAPPGFRFARYRGAPAFWGSRDEDPHRRRLRQLWRPLLENEPRLTLIVAERSLARADGYCKNRDRAVARVVPALFDRDGDIVEQLSPLRPDILIDASGPFQAYGEGRYRLIEACIDQGVNYLDLADGSDFVAGVSAFNEAARTVGLFVLSGVSSFPVLTAAVRRLSLGMARVDSIRGGIAPSPFAGVGENVIRVISGYAGQPVKLVRNGRSALGHPFTEQTRYTIAPPGRLPLRNTLFSLVDVPDLRALSELWPEAKTIWMGAGPVPEVLHRALIGLAWLVRARTVRSLSPLASLMQLATNRLRWGEHRGRMFVEVAGSDQTGVAATRSWHLLAESNDGPLIPSMAVEALVRKALDGHEAPPGARAAVHDLELEDYEALFASKTINTGFRNEPVDLDTPFYAALLGDAWLSLPDEIRAMHDGTTTAEGRAPGRART